MTLYFIFIIIKNLFFTELIESIIAFFIGIRDINNIKSIILINVITNVSLSFISIFFILSYKFLYKKSIIFLEILIIFIEAYLFNKTLDKRDIFFKKIFTKREFFRCLFLSIELNIFSIFLSRLVK